MLSVENTGEGKSIDGVHQATEWSLLFLVTAHLAAALASALLSRSYHEPHVPGLRRSILQPALAIPGTILGVNAAAFVGPTNIGERSAAHGMAGREVKALGTSFYAGG
jgi:hypothetical protein